PTATYVIVGDGDDRSRLERLVSNLELHPYVRFVGRAPQHELADYYRMADLFVMPSTGEGFGIVYLEAAASGLPVIASNCDGSVDALAEGCMGRLVNPKSSTDLFDAICSALEGRWSARPGDVARFSFENFSRHVDRLVQGLCYTPRN